MADRQRLASPAPLDETRKRTLMGFSLVVLLHRAGGRRTFTESEYNAVLAEYGGRTRINVRLEIVRDASGPAIEVRLESKRPGNAELPYNRVPLQPYTAN